MEILDYSVLYYFMQWLNVYISVRLLFEFLMVTVTNDLMVD